MNKILNNIESKIYYVIVFAFLALLNSVIIFKPSVNLIFLLLSIEIFFFLFFIWEKYYLKIYVFSLMFGVYLIWSLQINIVTVVSIINIFFYITFSNDEKYFNNLHIPKFFKLIVAFLLFAVLLSEILSPYLSILTIASFLIFLIALWGAYVSFKSIKDYSTISDLLYTFIIMVFISGITKVLVVIYSGRLRGLGLSEYFYMEYSPICLIILFFLYIINKRPSAFIIFATIFIFILMILDQSRFAWLGFFLSIIYGGFICYKFTDYFKAFMEKRISLVVAISILIISLIFIFGLDKIIIERVSDINFKFFEQRTETEGGTLVGNSLESRILIWITAINTFIHNPITGVGYLQFFRVSEDYNVLPGFLYNMYVKGLDAHTTYMNFLAETGIIGLSAILTYMITSFILSIKSIKITNGEWKILSITLNVLMFYLMIDCIYSGSFTLGPAAFLWHLLIALNLSNFVLANAQNQNYKKRNEKTIL